MKSQSLVSTWLFLASSFLLTQGVLAGDVLNGSGVAQYGELDGLRSRNAILIEQLKAVKLNNDILGASPSGQIPQLPGMGQPGIWPSGQIPKLPGLGQLGASTTAEVWMVSGTENNLMAVISLPSGSRVNARVGTSIPGLGTVKSIARNEVSVSVDKAKAISLPFASDNTTGSMLGGPR